MGRTALNDAIQFPTNDVDIVVDDPVKYSSLPRWLAEIGEGPYRIDYSVLSVAVMTLGLIMMVEVVRHRLDHAAVGRPFYKAVLEGVYAELATLGMVEFFIWLLQSYYKGLNVAKELVFAQVHFTLFYTAILNAFQSVVVAILAMRISHRLWVQTETLELNHYVEIREEFVRVKAELESLHYVRDSNKAGSHTSSDDNNNGETNNNSGNDYPTANHWKPPADNSDVEFVLEFNLEGLRGVYKGLMNRVRYPRLRRKYHELLTQIRFHELRVHLLQAYHLPLKLKVSDYLIRSQQAVLIKLVDVSIISWLLLTACINVLYFVFGIVATETENAEIVGEAMTVLFFCMLGLFVGISMLVFNKMKSIFRSIMHEKVLWDLHEESEEKHVLAKKQLRLFWGGDPTFVIAAIQTMQFGYAVALSVIIIFWDTIDDGDTPMVWYFVSIVVCYALFVWVVAEVLPRYTLCTSLGQLVDLRRLHETVALFHLHEARRQNAEDKEQAEWENAVELVEHKPPITGSVGEKLTAPPAKARRRVKSSSDGVKRMAAGGSSQYIDHQQDSAAIMAELVKLDTSSLRHKLPESEREVMSQREKEKEIRRRRRRTVSEGVADMASGISKSPTRAMDDLDIQLKSCDSIAFFKADPVRPLLTPASETDERLQARRDRRSTRKKALSDGVALMAKSHRFGENERALSTREKVATKFHGDDSGINVDPLFSEDHTGTPPFETKANATHNRQLSSIFEVSQCQLDVSSDSFDDKASIVSPGIVSSGPAVVPMQAFPEEDNKSVGSEHSDADDLPKADLATATRLTPLQHPRVRFKELLLVYFLSMRYVVISNVFGTLVAFFLVGQRVERFLHTQDIVSHDFVSFDFDETYTFWLLTSWLVMFLIGDTIIVWIMSPFAALATDHQRKLFLSAVADGILVSACLTLFLIAEGLRCCNEDSAARRWMAEAVGNEAVDNNEAPCTCPTFGSRLYGGLGSFEPFVSLFAIRVFRHWLTKRFIALASSKCGWSKGNEEAPWRMASNMDPFAVFGHGKSNERHGHVGPLGHDEIGTIVELWEAAIGKYPEIVSNYGQFSGEVLQAMLGLSVMLPEPEHTADDDATDFNTPDAQATESSREAPKRPQLLRGKSFAVSNEYTDLSAHTQEIIMAGKVGRAVKLVDSESTSQEHHNESHGDLPTDVPHFEVKTTEEGSEELDSLLFAPNARLVRSMRRCDRKLLPMLDSWTAVDVAITKFEMVYFDASDVDGDEFKGDIEDTRRALEVTKGGKGLRLCDVATGRRVVGHLQFSEITCIHVDREMPEDSGDGEEEKSTRPEVSKTEYWLSLKDHIHFARTPAWRHIKQDSLKIETSHGRTLFLRFYSDLEVAEHHPERLATENEHDGTLYKNNAFQWVQTIGRFCGPAQLLQELPHFGDDSCEELRDYLIVRFRHDVDTKGRGHRRKLSSISDGARLTFPLGIATRHRRGLSSGTALPSFRRGDSAEGMVDGREEHTAAERQASYRRAASTSMEVRPGRFSFHRRSSSMAEAEAQSAPLSDGEKDEGRSGPKVYFSDGDTNI